jgi:GNAT superfamily N-acetyltransferase
MRMVEGFPAFQLVALEGDEIVGAANSVRFFLDGSVDALPEGGWDWMLERAIADLDAGRALNALCGMQIAVRADRQGHGYSGLILSELKRRAREAGCLTMVVPVRPTWKSRYPLFSIDEYLSWQTSEGLPFDPWLRVHIRNGGRIVKPCHESMRISGSSAEWDSWTGRRFPAPGRHIVPGALEPVTFDQATGQGIYIEPNVWVEHPLD